MLRRMVEIGRQRLTHRYDLPVLLKTLVQSLLEGVYDHPHPLGRDYDHDAGKQIEIREDGRAGNQLEFCECDPVGAGLRVKSASYFLKWSAMVSTLQARTQAKR